jgi:hypothetical protein
VIEAVAFCPHPPVLVPEVAQGAASELAELRAACRTAIERIVAPGRRLVVLGGGPDTASHAANARGSLAGFGVRLEIPLGSGEPGPVELPLSLTIGAWLLREALGPDCGAIGYSIGPGDADLPGWDAAPPTALVVMADGSARRSIVAPGYLDERAAGFDALVAEALRSGAAQLLHVDPTLAGELLVAGADAWDAAARLLEGSHWCAELLYDDAPYGVGYFVAAWTGDA